MTSSTQGAGEEAGQQQQQSTAANQNDLINYIIDLDDEDCPEFGLHLAAYQGDVPTMVQILDDHGDDGLIDKRIRPFLATPLRLAATSGQKEAVSTLLKRGARVDVTDVKAQTPLFIAVVNQHWECAEMLLSFTDAYGAGADPNGSDRNLCTPLAVAAQRGYAEGVRLLCQYGADTEDVLRLMSNLPGFPLTTTCTYQHLECFATLLVMGAKPDLSHLSHFQLHPDAKVNCSVPHTVIKYKCPKEFLYLYREFGGNMFIRDKSGQLASQLATDAPCSRLIKQLEGGFRSSSSFAPMMTAHRFGLTAS